MHRVGVVFRARISIPKLLDVFRFVVSVAGQSANYGRPLPNGTWTSYLGELQRDNIDILVGPVTDTEVRRRDFQLLDTGT